MKITIYKTIEKHLFIEVDAPNTETAMMFNNSGDYNELWEKAEKEINLKENLTYAPLIAALTNE